MYDPLYYVLLFSGFSKLHLALLICNILITSLHSVLIHFFNPLTSKKHGQQNTPQHAQNGYDSRCCCCSNLHTSHAHANHTSSKSQTKKRHSHLLGKSSTLLLPGTKKILIFLFTHSRTTQHSIPNLMNLKATLTSSPGVLCVSFDDIGAVNKLVQRANVVITCEGSILFVQFPAHEMDYIPHTLIP